MARAFTLPQRFVLVMAVLACGAAAGAGGEQDSPQVSARPPAPTISTFTDGSEGWVYNTTKPPTFTPAIWVPSGGSPGGYICGPHGPAAFFAPARFLGDQSRYFGQNLSFDVKISWPTDQTLYFYLVIEGANGNVMEYDFGNPQGEGVWNRLIAPLKEGSGWTATAPVQDILASITKVVFSINDSSNAGVTCFDNLGFGAEFGRLLVRPRRVRFPRVRVGHRWTETVELEGRGPAAAEGVIALAQPTDPIKQPFTLVSGGGAYSLERGQRRRVKIRFAPQRPGRYVNVLLISNINHPDHPGIAIDMAGTGYGRARSAKLARGAGGKVH